MFKKILLVIAIIVFVGTILYQLSPLWQNTDAVQETSQNETNSIVITTSPTGMEVGMFKGKITKVISDCNFDGICSIQIGNVSVITNMGGDPMNQEGRVREEKGNIVDIEGNIWGSIAESDIGKEVEVYAQKTGSNTFTIYGNSEFYVRFK